MKITCPKCSGQMQMPEGFTAGKYTCPLCNSLFMCEASGMTYLPTPSPNPSKPTVRKGGLILPKRRKMTYAEMKQRIVQQQQTERTESGNGTLCFFLGLLFGLFGLIAAAIIGKDGGVKKAMFGFGIWLAVIFFFGYKLI